MGFTLHGPVAFDPINERELHELDKSENFPCLGNEGLKTSGATTWNETAAGSCADHPAGRSPNTIARRAQRPFVDVWSADDSQLNTARVPGADTDAEAHSVAAVADQSVGDAPDVLRSQHQQDDSAVSSPAQPVRMSYAAATEWGKSRSVREPKLQVLKKSSTGGDSSASKKKKKKKKNR